MASLSVECLRCGETRTLHSLSSRRLDAGECPRCGYVGWAASAELDEPRRRQLRERPVPSRRLHVVA
jgi:transposase